MQVNIENLVNQVAREIKNYDPRAFGYQLKELVRNLKELKENQGNGNAQKALDNFFELYTFNKKRERKVANSENAN